jgi:hypothetical protein
MIKNEELGRMYEETVTACFKVLSQHLSSDT